MKTIDKIKQMISDGVLTQEDAAKYFPELIESEDERIRKEIIAYFEADWAKEEGITRPDWIAYLEKQGEQKPIDKIQLGKKYKCITSPRYSTFVEDLIYSPKDEFLCSLMNLCSNCFEPIEDGEQKPIEEANGEDHFNDGLETALHILEKTYGKVQGYQTDDGILEHQRAITALKKLCEQKPVEWTDNDEYIRNSILHTLNIKKYLSEKKGDSEAAKKWHTYYNWFKTRCPKNS